VDAPPRRLAGRYLLVEPIGRGGMGVVWRAHDELLDRVVAVKEVLYHALSQQDRERFNRRTIREARAAGRLAHPNVVVVHDVIEEDGRPWIVMQLVPARSLGEVIKTEGPLPPERVAAIGAQVLDALRTAHEAGVLHRDVKPENVLLGTNGRVVLTDFGIATMTQETGLTVTGAITGTPAYLPPERLNGLPATPESDLWSLGATLYAAVEGQGPFDRGAPVPTMAAILKDPPRPARRAGPLGPVLDGLLRKDPDARMDARRAGELLRAVASGAPAAAPAPAGADAPIAGGGTGADAGYAGAAPPGRRDAPTRAATGPGLETGAPGAAGTRGTAPGTHTPPGRPPQQTGPARPDGPPPARRRRGPLIAIALGVPALAVAGGAAWYALAADGRPGPTPGAGAATTPAASASPSSAPPQPPDTATQRPSPATSAGRTLPPGWRLHQDREGRFSVALPRGWAEFDRLATSVKFRGPGSSGYLHIDWTTPDVPETGPVEHFTDLERRVLREGRFPGYRRLRLDPVRYLGREAADWEFTYRLSSGTAHVLNRGLRTEDDRPFAIYWQTRDAAWRQDQDLLRVFLSTFRPA
jgi:Serine/threonine protein kinase